MTGESLNPSFEILPTDIENVNKLFLLIERDLHYKDQRHKLTDSVEVGMLEAIYPELLDGGRLRPHIDEVFALRRMRRSFYPPGYSLRTLQFAIDKQMRQFFPDTYPSLFSTKGSWDYYEAFEKFDYFELVNDALENLRSSDVNSYGPEKIFTNALGDHWRRRPVVLDTGMGLGVGLKKWKMNQEYPYTPIRTLRQPKRGQAISHDLREDFEAQTRVDELANAEPVIQTIVGYDILPINPEDKSRVDLTDSSTFPMSQRLLYPQKVVEFHNLLKESSPDVHLLTREMIDATDPQDLALLSQYLPDGKADIFTFSGVLLQIPPKKRAQFFYNFLPLCAEGAQFFIKEWANTDPSQPNGLRMISEDWWHKGHFKLFRIDAKNLDVPPELLAVFLSRQCEQMYLTPGGRRILMDGI
jgi:hypothetical protein